MTFIDELTIATTADREFLLTAPVIERCLRGDVDHALYLAYLTEAQHHVRHTVPLMRHVRARLSSRHHWLREQLDHYVEEEAGHERWILDDIAAAGGDPDRAATSQPAPATAAMIAYAYDTVMYGNSAGFFGMVFVLEGTSVALALDAADAIQRALQLPDTAFSYLRSHGMLDREHVRRLESILERLTGPDDRAAVVRCAKGIFRLYGGMFRGLESPAAVTTQPLRWGTA